MRNSQEMYKSILSYIEDFLKRQTFVKKGDTFYHFSSDNWGLINIQKEQLSQSREIRFTINLGICSNSIRAFFDNNINIKPKIEECHWRQRIGILLYNKDHWWFINDNSRIDQIVSEVKSALNEYAIPEIKQYISDESLEKYWLSGKALGITDFDRYIYLTILMKYKKRDNLKEVIDLFIKFSRGRGTENSARIHVQELGFKYE